MEHAIDRRAIEQIHGAPAHAGADVDCVNGDAEAEVLLERGAARVYAIDVGYGQLAAEAAKFYRDKAAELP